MSDGLDVLAKLAKELLPETYIIFTPKMYNFLLSDVWNIGIDKEKYGNNEKNRNRQREM